MLELLMMCAPAVDPVTMAAVVKQESGGQPWVINNNTTKNQWSLRPKLLPWPLRRRLLAAVKALIWAWRKSTAKICQRWG
jgi:hypothetical protein